MSVCMSRLPPPSLLNMSTGVTPLSLMMQQNNLALMRSVTCTVQHLLAVYCVSVSVGHAMGLAQQPVCHV